MSSMVAAGMVLTSEALRLPPTLLFESEPYIPGWRLIKNLDADGIGRRIFEARWTFFCLAGQIKATVIGSEGQKTLRRAVKQILAKQTTAEFNCLEVTGVVAKHFLGVPYTSVRARSRHIQQGVLLFRAPELQAREKARPAA